MHEWPGVGEIRMSIHTLTVSWEGVRTNGSKVGTDPRTNIHKNGKGNRAERVHMVSCLDQPREL